MPSTVDSRWRRSTARPSGSTPAAHGGRAARARRPRRLLDLLVRQLAADPAVRPRVGRALSRPRAGRRRRARARVRVRARRRQRAPRDRRAGRRLPGGHRQRLRHLAIAGQPLLAGAVPRRSRRATRFRHFGEGAYEDIERALQQLLGVDEAPTMVEAGGRAEAADWDGLRSPETYLGRARGERRRDAQAGELALNEWALAGDWSVGEEAAVLDTAGGSLAYRFEGRDLNLVLAPPVPGARVGFAVRSTAGRPATRTESTPTSRARAPSTSRGCTSSSAGARAPPSALSRSPSSTPVCAPTCSPSASCTSRPGCSARRTAAG